MLKKSLALVVILLSPLCANAALIAFDSTGTSPDEWDSYSWQGQGWLIGSASGQLEQGFQFVPQSTGILSDLWLRGLFNSSGGYDYTRGNTVVEIQGAFGDVLDAFTVNTEEPGTTHYLLDSNLMLSEGSAYWVVLRGENLDSYYGWTLTESVPPYSYHLPHAFRYASGVAYNGDWQFNVAAPGGFAIGVSQVPIPATLALFGIGLAGLGWSRRKKA